MSQKHGGELFSVRRGIAGGLRRPLSVAHRVGRRPCAWGRISGSLKRKDEKVWREIEGMIKAGEDMVAKFSTCATSEEWKDMVDRANVIREAYWVRDKEEGVDFTE